MKDVIRFYQDLPIDVDTSDIVENTDQAINALGGFDAGVQAAALVSLAIGVVLMVMVWAWSRTKDENTFRNLLREQTEYVTKQLRETDEKLESEIELRRQKEDTIGEKQRQLDDCTHLVNQLKAVSGNGIVKLADIETAEELDETKPNLPTPNDSGDVENIIALPTLDFDELIEGLPITKPLDPLPRTRAQARNTGAGGIFE